MKKTVNVNLNGSVFTIDEDAYGLLDNYLSNLRIYFQKEEGATEIIADFEARIGELFSEKIRLGHQVITIEHVEEVITRVGKPADFAEQEEAKEEKKTQTPYTGPMRGKKKFYRNIDDKLLGGVCSGLAAYFDWSVVAIRFILILSPFVLSSLKFLKIPHLYVPIFPPFIINSFWFWIFIAYLVMWAIVPAAITIEQKLQMLGKPITVENIGKTVSAQSAPLPFKEPKGCLEQVVEVFVTFLKVCLAGLGCLIGLPLLFVLIVVIIALFATMLGVGGGLLSILPSFLIINHPVLASITGILLLGIPVFVIFYSLIASIGKSKPLSRTVKLSLLFSWIVALILFLACGFKLNRNHDFANILKWPFASEFQEVRGNNIPSQKTFVLDESFDCLAIEKYISADIQIEQTSDTTPSIEINGDENLVDEVNYDLRDGRLVLSTNQRLRSNNNLKIKLQTDDLKTIQTNFVGKIHLNRAFTGDKLEITMRGVGTLHADSMFVSSLIVRTEGVGSVNIAGKSDNVRFETAGTGKIDAMELLSDTVYARVDGVGSIHCNPVEYLEGSVNGVGSLVYKEEPKQKNVSRNGVGKISKR